MNEAVPEFEVDPFWPKPLPNNWVVGQVPGVAVDRHDHVWITHRPGSLDASEAGAVQDPPISESGVPAPSVIEFDQEGNLVRAWGGVDGKQPWLESEHGIYVDGQDNVWVSSNGADHLVLKFTADGEHLLTLGRAGETNGSNDTELLGRTADITVDDEANEVYLADGYGNRRIIVFDATTGEYKRHWGSFGEPPVDGDLEPYDPSQPTIRSFRNPVHSVVIARDGLVYVTDRINDRIQVFQKDGTYVAETFIRRETRGAGSTWDVELSNDPDQTFLYVPDGTNFKVWILNRQSLEIVGSFGRGGRWAGMFEWVHNLAGDSQGNLYTAEVHNGKRVQKFRRVN